MLKAKQQEIKMHSKGIRPLDNGTISFSVTANVSHFEILSITGISLPSRNPTGVFATVRAPNDDNPLYSDSSSLTVNEVEQDVMRMKIWRIDSSQDPSAAIRIDVLVVP